ncbi:hypothetical protein EB796_017406 [Bugula neritina]|uniref:Uncharacterized protein n=1 Tax=Bugula neritina TaxID=10212 RepID=A0A7J7JDD0_BUGNE|nr:hypothetical protein EB796_017406 [Bugula neritina]
MVAEDTESFLEPNPLDAFSTAEIKQLADIGDKKRYMLKEVDTDEILILEIVKSRGITFAKNVFGDVIFRCKGNITALDGKLTLQTQNSKLVGRVENQRLMRDVKTDDLYAVALNKFKSKGIHYYDVSGPMSFDEYYNDELDDHEKVGFISIAKDQVALGVNDLQESSVVKALVIVRAVQLLTSEFKAHVTDTAVFPEYINPVLPFQRLGCLENVDSIVLENLGIDSSCAVNHYSAKASDGNVNLTFDYSPRDNFVMLVNESGLEQCRALNFGKSCDTEIKLHGKRTLGYLRQDRCHINNSMLEIRQDREYCNSAIKVYTDSGHCIAQISKEVILENHVVNVKLEKILNSCEKGVMLFVALDFAIKNNLSTNGTCKSVPRPLKQNMLTKKTSTLMNSSLATLSVATISKVGQKPETGIHFYEVQDAEKLDRVCLVLEVKQRPGQMDGEVKDSSGKLLSVACGLWGEADRDLCIYSDTGALLGVVVNDLFYEGATEVMRVEKFPDPEQTQDSYSQEMEHPMVFQVGSSFNNQVLAQVRGCGSEVQVLFSPDEKDHDAKRKALILCYAFKLAFNEFHIYKEQMASLEYEYDVK